MAAFVDVVPAAGTPGKDGPGTGTEPALFAGHREIAHLEPGGGIDLRVTRAGWAQARQDFAADPAVCRDPARRDWIELHVRDASDFGRLAPLLAIAAAVNA